MPTEDNENDLVMTMTDVDMHVAEIHNLTSMLTMGALLKTNIEAAVVTATMSFRVEADPSLSDDEVEAAITATMTAVRESKRIDKMISKVVDQAVDVVEFAREFAIQTANESLSDAKAGRVATPPTRSQRRRRRPAKRGGE